MLVFDAKIGVSCFWRETYDRSEEGRDVGDDAGRGHARELDGWLSRYRYGSMVGYSVSRLIFTRSLDPPLPTNSMLDRILFLVGKVSKRISWLRTCQRET